MLVNAWVELFFQAVNSLRKFYYSGLRASSLHHVALSKVSPTSKQKDQEISVIRVDDARASLVPSVENHTRISLFVLHGTDGFACGFV